MFRVGDRVTVKAHTMPEDGRFDGKVGTIEEVSTEERNMLFECTVIFPGMALLGYGFNFDELEAV